MTQQERYQRRMAQNAWRRWQNREYKADSVYTAYKTPSVAKTRAWAYCERACAMLDGYGLVVMSANTFRFTAGFEYVDKNTGVVSFMFITPDYDYSVDTLTTLKEIAENRRRNKEQAA